MGATYNTRDAPSAEQVVPDEPISRMGLPALNRLHQGRPTWGKALAAGIVAPLGWFCNRLSVDYISL
jgi:hypothetical protein